MSRSRDLAILLAPKGEAGARLLGEAKRWLSAGIIEDFVWIRAEDLAAESGEIYELPCRYVGDSDASEPFDLFQYLGTFQVRHLDLIVPWFLADSAPDVDFANQGIRLRKSIAAIIPKPSVEMQSRSKQLFATLLSIPSAKATRKSFPAAPVSYGDFELNLVVSPESRAEPWTFSSPVKGDESFALFALAQIASVAGVWSGSPQSVSSLLYRRGFTFSQGNVVMVRSMASLVVAQGVASRMITEALEIVANPDLDPYKISNQNELERPESIAELASDLIRSAIDDRVKTIIAQTDNAFIYDGPKKPTEADYSRSPKEAWIFFWHFTRDVVIAMPHYARAWVMNKYGELTNALLKNVREPVPEKYLGLDKELRERLAKILEFRADRETQDALAISATAFQQTPQVWEKLRSLAFGAMDGSDSEDPSSKPLVFPSVDYVAANPDNRFVIQREIQELLGLELDLLAVDDVSAVRDQVSKMIHESNSNLDLMRKRLAAFENGTILVDDPNQSEAEEQPLDESQTETETSHEWQADSSSEPDLPVELAVKPARKRSPAPTRVDIPTFVNDAPLVISPSLESTPEVVAPQPEHIQDAEQPDPPLAGMDELDAPESQSEPAPPSTVTPITDDEADAELIETSLPLEESTTTEGETQSEQGAGESESVTQPSEDLSGGGEGSSSGLQGLLEFANEMPTDESSNTQLTTPVNQDEDSKKTGRKFPLLRRRKDEEK